MSNHNNSDLDWWWAAELASAMKLSPLAIKWFVKAVVFYVPIFGTVARALGHIGLSREWSKDRLKIRKAMNDLVALWPKPHIFAIFPEGTRKTAAKLKLAKKFARERGLQVLTNCLQPRVKGFLMAVDVCKKAGLRLLFNCTNQSVPKALNSWDLILGRYHELEIHIEIINLLDLPEDEEELTNWLRSAWVDKDKLIDTYQKSGFDGVRILPLKNRYAHTSIVYAVSTVTLFAIVSRWNVNFAIYWCSLQVVCLMYVLIRAFTERKVKLT